MNKEKLKQMIEAAILLLEQLEAAIAQNNQRQIGARLYELRHELNLIRSEVEDGKK